MARRGKFGFASTAPKGPPPAVTFDTLVESLKQGNALELEFIKKLKEGLDVIADGLQAECFNRSDALSELRKKMGEERAKLDPTATAERKTNLTMLLQSEIEECQAAIVRNESRYTGAQAKAHADYKRELGYVVQVDKRDGERGARTMELLLEIHRVFPSTGEALGTWVRGEQEKTDQDVAAADAEADSVLAKRVKRLEEAKTVYEEVKRGLLAHKESLEQVAKLVDVEVYET